MMPARWIDNYAIELMKDKRTVWVAQRKDIVSRLAERETQKELLVDKMNVEIAADEVKLHRAQQHIDDLDEVLDKLQSEA